MLPESEVHGTLKSQLMLICRRVKESFSDPACFTLTVTFPAAVVSGSEYACVKSVREDGQTEGESAWVDSKEGISDSYSCSCSVTLDAEPVLPVPWLSLHQRCLCFISQQICIKHFD